MRILIAHNRYQHLGGEDSVVDSEVALLQRHGHEVEIYRRTNDDIKKLSAIPLAAQTLWSSRTSEEIAREIHRFHPDVIHVHNTFPLISPSLYWAAAKHKVPLVQTLHNFRMMCLNALYLRDGNVCEDCSDTIPWRGISRRCYRGSLSASAVLGSMLIFHRGIGTYQNKVARYIALNEFCRNKFVEGGLPGDRIVVKPNFVDAPAPSVHPRSGLLFVGRLSQEKGLDVLVNAVSRTMQVDVSVAGSGPLADILRLNNRISALGNLNSVEVRSRMERAVALVVPSIWYENFPRTIVEAFAAGLPVIASRIGALADIVREGKTGLLFRPGDPEDLSMKMAWAASHPHEMAAMGARARDQFEREFSPEVNHRMLLSIYEDAQCVVL